MESKIALLMNLLQFSDSTFPVGTFSFSNGLESAAHEGLVHDAVTLGEYAASVAWQAANSDGIAALHAYRAVKADDIGRLLEVDRQLEAFKQNEEARQMLRRMGRKMVELCVRIFEEEKLHGWLREITEGRTPGSYPVAQGLVFALAGLSEKSLFSSHQYGVLNMVLSAALRCVKVSHYETQILLSRLSVISSELYDEVCDKTMEEMNAFVPQVDILASLHEKGTMRMFMN